MLRDMGPSESGAAASRAESTGAPSGHRPPERSHDSLTILGSFIRTQREMANLSLRQLSALTAVSNPYLSQIERGLSQPSIRVLKSIAEALDVSAEALYERAGLIDIERPVNEATTEAAIRSDRMLTDVQRRALLAVYHSYLEANARE